MKSFFGLFILILIIAFGIYMFKGWQKNGKFFGFSPYKNVSLVDLLSYASLYDGKKICTRGFYVQEPDLSIIKVSLTEDEFTRSSWVKNPTENEIIPQISSIPNRYVDAEICGPFESRRAGEFGNPAVWDHQITVEKFQTFGDSLPFNN